MVENLTIAIVDFRSLSVQHSFFSKEQVRTLNGGFKEQRWGQSKVRPGPNVVSNKDFFF